MQKRIEYNLRSVLVVLLAIIVAAVPLVLLAADDTDQQTITLTVNETISLTLGDATLALSALTPGSAVSTSTTATVETNSGTGWEFRVERDSAASTLANGGTTFPDATEWDPTANTNTGNGVVAASVGANLHFRVTSSGTTASLYDTDWWGADDAGGNAKYAGFPTSSLSVAERTDYAAGSQTVAMAVRADAPSSQAALAYSGTITITAITKP